MKHNICNYFAVLMLFWGSQAGAQTIWYGTVSTDWNNRTNWTPSWDMPLNIQSVPASGANITIGYPCNYYPIVTNNLTIGALIINDGTGGSVTVAAGTLIAGAITVNQYCTFTINPGATVNASSGGITWVVDSTLNIYGTLNAGANALNVNGNATVSGGSLTSGAITVNSGGSLTVTNGSLTAGALTMYNGSLTINLNATATFNGGATAIDGGNLTISSGATATFSGGLLLNSSGNFTALPGSTVNIPGPITGYGTCNISGGIFTLSGGSENVPAGAYTSLLLNGVGTYGLPAGTSVSGNLSIASGTVVSVASGANIPVGNLTLNGVTQASGTWGYSGRTHNNTTYFANTTGYLTVANGPAASKLVYTTVPASGTAGTALSVTVQSQDGNGNPASPTSNTTITLSKATGGGTLSGTLTGTISTSGNSVTISTPVYSKSDTMTLTAAATAGETGLTAVTSGGIVFSAGAATQMAFTSMAVTTALGVASSNITVQRQDQFGNPVTAEGTRTATLSSSSTGTVTFNPASLSIASGSSSANFTYTDTKSDTPTITAASTSPGTITSATQSETVTKASTSVTVASSKNPSGFKDSVNFTAALPATATGSVLFLTNGVAFSTVSLISGIGSSGATTLLPRGTNIITAQYAGDVNYFGSTNTLAGGQVVTNHPPAAVPMTVTRTAGLKLLIALSDVGTNWSDVDGDTVTVSGINLVTTNNVNLATNSTWILYPSSPNVADQISYSISDGQGGTNIGFVNIVVNSSVTGTNSIVKIVGGNPTTVMAYGIPGYSYIAERSTNLTSWVDISTNTAATNGGINVNDNFGDLGGNVPSSAYYRLKWQP
jgi:hypothetical protein